MIKWYLGRVLTYTWERKTHRLWKEFIKVWITINVLRIKLGDYVLLKRNYPESLQGTWISRKLGRRKLSESEKISADPNNDNEFMAPREFPAHSLIISKTVDKEWRIALLNKFLWYYDTRPIFLLYMLVYINAQYHLPVDPVSKSINFFFSLIFIMMRMSA